MGQHAEDLLEGDVDCYSGEWLGNGQGFPRSQQYGPQHRERDHNLPLNPTAGVMNWLANYARLARRPKATQGISSDHAILRRYAEEVLKIEIPLKSPIKKLCKIVSGDFKPFTMWVIRTYGK